MQEQHLHSDVIENDVSENEEFPRKEQNHATLREPILQ